MTTLTIIGLAIQVLLKLLPIAKEVYAAVQDPAQPDVQAGNALNHIQARAAAQGLAISHTEAELARSALHYAVAKTVRHAGLALEPPASEGSGAPTGTEARP